MWIAPSAPAAAMYANSVSACSTPSSSLSSLQGAGTLLPVGEPTLAVYNQADSRPRFRPIHLKDVEQKLDCIESGQIHRPGARIGASHETNDPVSPSCGAFCPAGSGGARLGGD